MRSKPKVQTKAVIQTHTSVGVAVSSEQALPGVGGPSGRKKVLLKE